MAEVATVDPALLSLSTEVEPEGLWGSPLDPKLASPIHPPLAAQTPSSMLVQSSSATQALASDPIEFDQSRTRRETANRVAKRARTRIDAPSKEILSSFFKATPYPNTEALDHIAQQLGLSRTVIQTWGSNHRSRLGRIISCASSSSSKPEPAHQLPVTSSNLHCLAPVDGNEIHEALPETLSRFLQIPVAEDPGLLALYQSADARQLVSQNDQENSFGVPQDAFYDGYARDSWPHQNSRSGSEASGESLDSRSSAGSGVSRSRRRGRRLYTPSDHVPTDIYMPADPCSVPFLCTYCGAEFTNRYSWSRHEISVHTPNEVYICRPSVTDKIKASLGSPVSLHFRHSVRRCHAKTLETRVFQRAEHLTQHIRQCHLQLSTEGPLHQVREDNAIREAVKTTAYQVPIPKWHDSLRCGFCGVVFDRLSVRTKHVADHFTAGSTMDGWWLGRRSLLLDRKERNDWDGHLTIWSCAHLNSPRDAFSSLATSTSFIAGLFVCLYCREVFIDTPDWAERIMHLRSAHAYRGCLQPFFSSITETEEHLMQVHASTGLQSDHQRLFLARRYG